MCLHSEQNSLNGRGKEFLLEFTVFSSSVVGWSFSVSEVRKKLRRVVATATPTHLSGWLLLSS